MSWTPHVTVAAIIERQGRFLMVEEQTTEGLRLNQPAGHLEQGESLVQAVVRETREETARDFNPLVLIGVYRWQVPLKDLTYLRFCFHGETTEPLPGQPLDEAIVGLHWMSRSDLAERAGQLRSPLVLTCIDDYLHGHRYPLELLNEVP
jgi:8-oxo-dGTP pyrophosphatase MutT (NUDIX family)